MAWRGPTKYFPALPIAMCVVGFASEAIAQQHTEQDWIPCAIEHGYCHLTRPTYVRYGLAGKWVYRAVTVGGIACTNEAFGSDPAKGFQKGCEVLTGAKPEVIPPELYPMSPSE